MKNRRAGKAFLVLVGLAFGLIGGEIVLRFLDAHYYRTDIFLSPHPIFGYSYIPGKKGHWRTGEFSTAITINSHGLHDVEHSYEKKGKETRILILGDSFMAGMEVSEDSLFSRQLQKILGERYEKKVEVINGGITGYGTAQELLFFKEEGRKYGPDLVLLAFFNENDAANNLGIGGVAPSLYPYYHMDADSRLSLRYTHIHGPPPLHNVWRNTHIYRFFAEEMGAPLGESIFPPDQYYIGYLVSRRSGMAWALTLALLTELRRRVEDGGGTLSILSIPGAVEYRAAERGRLLKAYPQLEEYRWDADRPEKILLEYCTKKGVPFFPLRPYFLGLGDGLKKMYFTKNGHWNALGHRMVAEQAAIAFVSAGIL